MNMAFGHHVAPTTFPASRPAITNAWTSREIRLLTEHWPDVEAIRNGLPHRSRQAISAMAKKCGLSGSNALHMWTAAEHSKLRKMAAAGCTYADIAATLGITATQVQNRLRYSKLTIAKRRPVPVRNPLVHEVRQRAFDMNISLSELRQSVGRKRAFREHTKVGIGTINKVVKALGGRLTIEWESLH